jgi:hypothetical protein
MDLVFNTANGLNGFDSLGHYLRALLLVTNCVDYRVAPLSGCSANWAELDEASSSDLKLPSAAKQDRGGEPTQPAPGDSPGFQIPVPEAPPAAPESPVEPPAIGDEIAPPATPGDEPEGDAPDGLEPGAEPQSLRKRMRAARTLLDFLMGDDA